MCCGRFTAKQLVADDQRSLLYLISSFSVIIYGRFNDFFFTVSSGLIKTATEILNLKGNDDQPQQVFQINTNCIVVVL